MRFLIFALGLLLVTTPLAAKDQLSADQQEEVRQLVRDTLLKNPEILMEAMQILQSKQEAAREEMQKAALSQLSDLLVTPGITPIDGNPDGDVTIVEFFDYQCGYCKRAYPTIMDVVNSDKNIRFVMKEFAILGPVSEIAARAALASQKQGKYKEFHKELMTVRGRLSEEKVYKTAEDLGMDVDQLKKDMQADDVSQEITSTRQIAQSLNITGTPAFIVGEQILPGAVPADTLKEAVKKARAKKK
ncbi:DsbA family protein [Terasakiella pusilla]|jgi:protein-disulfide isomerase|uniref:DsbA family protein n=1 Tax=Terasakiella pusilla TaxID=64973 RepID=UPI003AA832E6